MIPKVSKCMHAYYLYYWWIFVLYVCSFNKSVWHSYLLDRLAAEQSDKDCSEGSYSYSIS